MINLLPQDEKRKLLHEYWFRLGVVLLSGVLFLEVLSVIFFIPAYYALSLNTGDLAQTLAQKKSLKLEGASEAQENLTTIKNEITLLEKGNTIVDVLPSVLFNEIAAQKPSGIGLSAISYSRTANSASLQLTGNALTQDDLIAFRRNVKNNPRVLDFKYGSSIVILKTDINFTATVTFK